SAGCGRWDFRRACARAAPARGSWPCEPRCRRWRVWESAASAGAARSRRARPPGAEATRNAWERCYRTSRPPVHAVELREMPRELSRQRTRGQPPAPVAVDGSGRVESGLGAEAEKVLCGDDGELPDRAQRLADQGLGHGARRRPQHRVDPAARFLIEASVPAQGGVVVVRACVDDAVVLMHVRKMRIVALAAECELQDAHAWKSVAFAQRNDVVGDDTEIFGKNRQVAELIHQQPQEIFPGGKAPLPPAGIRGTGGDRPVRGEGAKVVDTQQVDALKLLEHPRAPVDEVVPAHRLPVIERVAPKLPGP